MIYSRHGLGGSVDDVGRNNPLPTLVLLLRLMQKLLVWGLYFQVILCQEGSEDKKIKNSPSGTGAADERTLAFGV